MRRSLLALIPKTIWEKVFKKPEKKIIIKIKTMMEKLKQKK